MKKLFLMILPAILVIVIFTRCQKDKPDGSIVNAKFYTERDTVKGVMNLYIDGNFKGALPYFTEDPGCDDTGDRLPTLDMQLESGTYLIEGKDSNGKVLSSGEIFFSKTKMSSSGGIGGQKTSTSDECMRIGLFE